MNGQVLGELFRQELQGHATLELGVSGSVDNTHPRAAQTLDDPVVENQPTGHMSGTCHAPPHLDAGATSPRDCANISYVARKVPCKNPCICRTDFTAEGTAAVATPGRPVREVQTGRRPARKRGMEDTGGPPAEARRFRRSLAGDRRGLRRVPKHEQVSIWAAIILGLQATPRTPRKRERATKQEDRDSPPFLRVPSISRSSLRVGSNPTSNTICFH